MLTDLLVAHGVSYAMLVEATGCAASTATRWISGETSPSYSSLRAISRSDAIPEGLRSAILCDLFPAYLAIPKAGICGDINKDGSVDGDDVLDGAILAAERTAAALREARAAQRDGSLTERERSALRGVFTSIKLACNASMIALDAVGERKTCKPLAMAHTA